MALNLLLGWEVGRRLPGRFGLAGLGWPELAEVGALSAEDNNKNRVTCEYLRNIFTF